MLHDSTHVAADFRSGVLVATVKCEKIAEYEASIVQSELASIAPQHAWKIALDLTQVKMLASVGLGMIVSLNRQCKTNKGRLALCGMDANLRNVFKITKLDTGLTIVPDQAAAIKAAQ